MIHVTLNTGHAVVLPADMVLEKSKRLLRALIKRRGGNLPGQGAAYRVEFTVENGSAAFTFYRGREPLTMNVACWRPEAAMESWAGVEQVYLDLSDKMPGVMAAQSMPERPTSVPWLATVILPTFGFLAKQDAGFIGHMEACFGLLLAESDVSA